MKKNTNFNFNKLSPFKWFVLENFPFIEADFDSLTEWQLFCKIGKEINKIIESQNLVGKQAEELTNAFNNLQNYVNNYFENLDVQEEINNKLNEMVEDGTLQEIISAYLNSKAIFGFDNVESMKNSTNLIDGSYAETLGFYNKNDGGNALYKIRNITNEDIVDNMFIIALNNNNLIAELIYTDTINIKQIGAISDGSEDISNYINNALIKVNKIIFEKGNYYVNQQINISKDNILLKGNTYRNSNIIFGDNGELNFIGTSITSGGKQRQFLTIENLNLRHYNTSTRQTPYLNLICCAYIKILNCWFYGKGKQILAWECFDSRIINTDFEWGGSSEDNIIGFELRSTNGDNENNPTYEYTNNLYFYGCRFESHVGKCIASTGTNTNKIIFESCKFESYNCLEQNAIRFTKSNSIYFTDCVFAGSLANTKNYIYIDQVDDFKVDGYMEHSQGVYSGKKFLYATGNGRRIINIELNNQNAYPLDYKTFGFESWDNNIYIYGDIKVNNYSNKDILVTDRGTTIASLNNGDTTLDYTILENGFLYVTAVGTYGQTTPQVVTINDVTNNKECNVMTIGSQYLTNCMPVSKGDKIRCTKNTMATVYISILYNRGYNLS